MENIYKCKLCDAYINKKYDSIYGCDCDVSVANIDHNSLYILYGVRKEDVRNTDLFNINIHDGFYEKYIDGFYLNLYGFYEFLFDDIGKKIYILEKRNGPGFQIKNEFTEIKDYNFDLDIQENLNFGNLSKLVDKIIENIVFL